MSLIASPRLSTECRSGLNLRWESPRCLGSREVRFGSKADICGATSHVRFTPDSDRKSRHPQKVMSALPVATGPIEACNQACFDGIEASHEDNRDRRGCGLGNPGRRGIADDCGYLATHEICGQRR